VSLKEIKKKRKKEQCVSANLKETNKYTTEPSDLL